MDTLLLGITVISLIVALVMSLTAWRLLRDEKERAAARVAALSAAAFDSTEPEPSVPASSRTPSAVARAPWKPAPVDPRLDPVAVAVDADTLSPAPHASGFLGAAPVDRAGGTGQKMLAIAAVALFVVLSGALMTMMSGTQTATTAAAGAPLELVSLSHARQNQTLSVSGLVRNPANGTPVQRLTAVVLLFDAAGRFVASENRPVDFLRLGAGDETPFVVSLDAPATVARYRVSFRTEDGVVPHVDRRGEPPAAEAALPVNVTVK